MADETAINAFKNSEAGPANNTVQRAMYGIDIQGMGNYLPLANDHVGYVFFTRPCLNLSYGNLVANRRLLPYGKRDPTSIESAIRAYLDPVSSRYQLQNQDPYPLTESYLVDQSSPFIGILSNSIVSLSGWPEAALDAYNTPVGLRQESQSSPDGYIINYGTYSLNATFKNVLGGAIQKLMQVWLMYMSSIRINEMHPYPHMVANSEFDFNTRIYRITTDVSRRIVREIFSTGASWPSVDTSPNNANFNVETPMSEEEREISYRFNCDGFMHNDPISVYEFNAHVAMFNPAMLENNPDDDDDVQILRGMADGSLYKLDTEELRKQYRYRAYPRINPKTMELEWYAARIDTIEL